MFRGKQFSSKLFRNKQFFFKLTNIFDLLHLVVIRQNRYILYLKKIKPILVIK